MIPGQSAPRSVDTGVGDLDHGLVDFVDKFVVSLGQQLVVDVECLCPKCRAANSDSVVLLDNAVCLADAPVHAIGDQGPSTAKG